jgi:PPM family protein phosphatase
MKRILSVYGACDVGCKKPNNEDMVLLNDEMFRDGSRKTKLDTDRNLVIAVADGIGGLDKGEVASEMALTLLREMLAKLSSHMCYENIKEAFEKYTQETHSAMLTLGEMGSTIVGLFLYEGKVYRFHAGDSRLYLMRNGGLMRLTVDHSLRESGGDPTAPSNIITNSLGGGGSAFIEFAEIEKPFQDNDIYLLSSDGLHDIVPPDEIAAVLKLTEEELGEAQAEKLLQLAKEASGKDNISVVTVKVMEIKQ